MKVVIVIKVVKSNVIEGTTPTFASTQLQLLPSIGALTSMLSNATPMAMQLSAPTLFILSTLVLSRFESQRWRELETIVVKPQFIKY